MPMNSLLDSNHRQDEKYNQQTCLHGAWWAAVSGVAQSQTRLKRLSSSSSSSSVYMSVPISQLIPLSLLPPVTLSLFSAFVTLFLCKKVHLSHIFLDSTYKQYAICLTSLSMTIPRSIHVAVNGHYFIVLWLENPRDGGDWWAAVSGVTQSRTRLK